MNPQATPVIQSVAPGNANHGVAQPVPAAATRVPISATALANKTINAVQPSPTHLSNPSASVRYRNTTMQTLPNTLTASRGLLKSP